MFFALSAACLCTLYAGAQDTTKVHLITYDEAIRIALGESYTVKYYKEEMDATHYSYLFTKAQFKPLLGFDFFAPAWDEGMKEIQQADGLPVYNSTGSLQVGGNLNFTYVLPTGGNLALSSRMYWENYQTTLSERDNEKLTRDQVYSRFALTFNQPIFTANKLKENMRVAELDYKKSSCYFTRIQMDIVYNVTEGFYTVYKLAYENRINQERLANSREAYRITKLKQETGNLPEGEILIAEITVAQDEARVMESEGKLETAKDEFKLLIGLSLKEEIDLKADMEFKGNISAYYDFTGLSTPTELSYQPDAFREWRHDQSGTVHRAGAPLGSATGLHQQLHHLPPLRSRPEPSDDVRLREPA